jgi:hypothetical protein
MTVKISRMHRQQDPKPDPPGDKASICFIGLQSPDGPGSYRA